MCEYLVEGAFECGPLRLRQNLEQASHGAEARALQGVG
jgi:hypothetical protein